MISILHGALASRRLRSSLMHGRCVKYTQFGFCQFVVSECCLAILQSRVEKSWYQPLLIVFLTEPWMLINDLQTRKDSVGRGSELDTVLTAIWMTPAPEMLISL